MNPTPTRLSRAGALRLIRSLESCPKLMAEIILRRKVDPRWADLQGAYQVLRGAWAPVDEPAPEYEVRQVFEAAALVA